MSDSAIQLFKVLLVSHIDPGSQNIALFCLIDSFRSLRGATEITTGRPGLKFNFMQAKCKYLSRSRSFKLPRG
jgi:hypothetical protein